MKRLCLALVLVLMVSAAASAEHVRIGGFGGNDTIIVEEMLERFIRPALEGTGITVSYEPVADDFQRYIVNALSAGTAPDLFYVDIFWAESLMRSGVLEPLNSYLAESDILKPDHIIDSLLDAFTLDGSIYGIPKDFNTLAVFYNKDLFDYAGVPYPDENDTWDTFHDKLAQVAAIDPEIYGLALQPEFARMGALAYAAGFKPFDEDGKSNLLDPAFVDAFTWYTQMAETGVGVMPMDISQDWGGGALAAERVGAALEGAWILGFLKDNAPNLNFGASLLPKHPGTGERGNLIFCVSWSMNAASENKEAAFKVLELLTSPEVQQWVLERGLAIPSRKALADNPYFLEDTPDAQGNAIVFKGASDGYVLPFAFGKYGGEWMDPINQALTAVMTGESTVEEALQDAQKRLEAVMSR
ncbi:MAG: ABC transporter substrate-binding protein [Limnochordia bacterium]|jgi:multiple sugar transport system substrate-binding protein